jgi:hypothetical protein
MVTEGVLVRGGKVRDLDVLADLANTREQTATVISGITSLLRVSCLESALD